MENDELFYITLKNSEFFIRSDQLQANTLAGEQINWYYMNTGKGYIAGIHFSPLKGINVSLNYQGWQPECDELDMQHHLLLSLEYKL